MSEYYRERNCEKKTKCPPRKVSKRCKNEEKPDGSSKNKPSGEANVLYEKYEKYVPAPMKKFGLKHIEIAKAYIPSALFYGAAAGIAILYFTDWKVVLRYLPYYGGKFKPLEQSKDDAKDKDQC